MSATAAHPETGRRAAWGWCLTLLLAGAPVWALYGMNPWGFNQRLAMASVYQVGVALLLLWGLMRQLRPSALALALRCDSLLAPLGWLFLWSCASLLWAHNDYEGSMKLLMWATALLLAALVVAWPARQWQLRALLGAVFAAGAMLSAYGILQVAYGIDWPPTLSIGFRPQLLFLNRNQAAEYLLVSWPLGLVLLARGGVPRWLSLLGWGALGLYFSCIMLSGSLAAQLVVAGQLAFMLAVWWRVALRRLAATLAAARREWHLIAVVPLLLLGIAFVLLPELLRALASIPLNIAAEVMEKWHFTHGGTTNAPYRLYPWLNTLSMIQDHALLGVGIGNWTVFYPAYQGAVWQDPLSSGRTFYHNVHNDYLEVLAELGVVGAVLAAWFAVRLMRVWWQLRTSVEGLLIIGPLGIAACALFSFPLIESGSLILCLLSVALLERARAQSAMPVSAAAATWAKPWRWVAICAAALSLLCISTFNYRLYRSEEQRLHALAAHTAKDFPAAAAAVQRLQAWMPWRQRESIFQVVALSKAGQHELLSQRLERALESYPHNSRLLQAATIANVQVGRHERALDHLLSRGGQIRAGSYVEEGGLLHLSGLYQEFIPPALIDSGQRVLRAGQSAIGYLPNGASLSYHPRAVSNTVLFDWSVNMATTLLALSRYEEALQHLRFAQHSLWMFDGEQGAMTLDDIPLVQTHMRDRWPQWQQAEALIVTLSAGGAVPAPASAGSAASSGDFSGQTTQ